MRNKQASFVEMKQALPTPMDQEQARRIRMLQLAFLFSMAAAFVVLLIFLYLLLTTTLLLARYMMVVTSSFIVLGGIALWFIRRRQLDWAVLFYILAVIAGLTTAIYLLGGVTGPVTIGLILVIVTAGLLGGIKTMRQAAFISGVVYVTLALLEANQFLHPWSLPSAWSWTVELVFFLAMFFVIIMQIGVFINQTERAFAAEQQRALELAEASRQAEQSATAERELREREARSATHLRETVAGYVDYLSRVAAGDYTARVDVGVLEEDVEGDPELHALGEYLNATVDALVAALNQAYEAQRRYAEQTWQTVMESGRVQPGFTYRQSQIIPEAEWLPQMARAVDTAAPVAEGEGAAVPLVINRQVLGALGGEHPDGRPWTDEELALLEAVTGQLAQTIESLRLLDDVQRRAVQERLVGEVTARMRETLDMETVLKTAVQEIVRSLDLPEVTIQMAPPPKG